MRYRESLVKYARKHGVTYAARKYRVNRRYVYRWIDRYDGNVRSLANRSTRPHHHPNEHTKEEIELIKRMYKKNKDTGLVRFWIKIKQRGYTRSLGGLYNYMRNHGIYKKRKIVKKKKVKKYVQMTYPGERIQVDIKYVPTRCIVGENKYYQYTAIDEYSRYRIIEIYDSNTTYEAYKFIQKVIKKMPYKIKEVRTDNGIQFTNRLISKKEHKTLFEQYLDEEGVVHDTIKPFTPKHNGKVERSHRKDEEWFYKNRRFYSLEDIRKQMKSYLRQYNNFPMEPLNWKSPIEMMKGGSQS